MDITRVSLHTNTFSNITHIIKDDAEKDMEVWFARELQTSLGYARWENFQVAINRAIDSCKTQGFNESDHFREITKMVTLGSGAKRKIQDFMLTRFACYLIAQNGDPKKRRVASNERKIEKTTPKLPKKNDDGK